MVRIRLSLILYSLMVAHKAACQTLSNAFLKSLLSCHLLLGRPLDLFPALGCHSVQCLVHLLSFLVICPTNRFLEIVFPAEKQI